MAPPKNPNKHTKTAGDPAKVRKMLGKRVRYIGLKEPNVCPTCGHKTKRGMVSEYEGKFYCQENCVSIAANVTAQ